MIPSIFLVFSMLKLAVFDLDGTLLRNTSAEIQLFRYLLYQHLLKSAQLLNFAREALNLLPQGLLTTVRRNKGYLYGIDVKAFRQILPQFCVSFLQPRLCPEMVERMTQLKQQKFCVVILSGTLQLILLELQTMLPVDVVIGSVIETKNGVFTGRVIGLHPYGKDKVKVLSQHFANRSLDYLSSFVFADRYSDVSLMELFGWPVAVHPSQKLRRLAQKRGWEIIE
ncbi:hypothetical protein DRQ00_02640 [candidate division KSB1 bacterium]|nr:MAG: hypothetical protein DRQ00_02640 [candidate division KSB1 bacterium]